MSRELVVEDNSLKGLLSSDGVTVVRFTAVWCGPCRMIAPIFKSLASATVPLATFVKCDVDINKELPRKFGVTSVPHIVILDKDGNVLITHTGATSENNFIDLIKEATAKLNQ